jgi:hypothetical protein
MTTRGGVATPFLYLGVRIMSSYKVIAPGFFGGISYSPTGKRTTLIVDKPFAKDKLPSWLEPMVAVKVTPADKAKATKTAKAEAAKAESDAAEVDSAMFVTGATPSVVETL